MPDDRDAILQRLRESIGPYADLYPSVRRRMEEIAESSDPFVQQFNADMVEGFRLREQSKQASLAARFGLTPKETQVALHLAGGGSIADYAALHGVSEQTVRTQLKAVFAKTGVNRQSALAVLFLGRAGGARLA